ncbi:MAG TPA: glycoside hydrolase domain-containing protein, partial [Gemmatimonadales bacterium]|nr:glycoside hydrolase domain-containing protein [Gemmatimonadales bacterium]
MEASSAADKMAALGFPEWSIIYYDFEEPSSEAKIKAFINGWTSQLHARHQNSGIYGSYLAAASWQGSGVDYPPDAIWPYKLDGSRSVFGLCSSTGCLPDDLWSNHQRIHQYVQNVSDTQGGIYDPKIDKNFADGPVAVYGATTSSNTIRINATLDGSAWPYGASSGVLSWQLTGPTPSSGGGVPATLSGQQAGVYTLVRTGGGPTGASLASITPAGSQTLMAGGSLTFTFNFVSGGVCTASMGFTSASCTPPTVTLTANPMSVNAGNSSTLTWSSSNATSCVASGGWSGSQPTSGSKSVTPSGTTTYTLTCSGTGGAITKSATVSVNSASGPAVYLVAYPQAVTAGTAVGLGWATSNADSCTASGGWSGPRPVSGGATVFPSTTTVYTLTCTGAGGGSGSASVTVAVTSAPSISLGVSPPAIDPGGTATLQWTTTGMTSCSSSGGWSGSKALSGSQQVSPASTTTYNLNCSGTAPAAQESVRNGGFSGTVTEWTLSSNFYANSFFGSCNLTCPGYAYVSEPGGSLSLSNNLFGTMRQDISLPATATSITLSFWVSISTLETGTTPYDVLSVSLLNTQGNALQLIDTFSNVNPGGYRKTTFDLTPYKGQTVRLNFVG